MKLENTLSFARQLDNSDPLKSLRKEFHIPRHGNQPAIYFTGNSLGLQPKSTRQFVLQELRDWKEFGVEGHFHAQRPWLYYHKFSKKSLAKLVGALPMEVVAMNQLTVNLHLMMTSFYRPTPSRYKIITEAGAFSSDQYAFESQTRLYGLNPDDAIIELKPRDGEFSLRSEDITNAIKQHKNELSLVIFGAVQYYSGQVFDIPLITNAAHAAGAIAGFDLAHAIGNVPMQLHRDQVDFAVWCSYKYLNSGPGGVAGVFVHEKHSRNSELKRLSGWWGHQESERFQMKKGFIPIPGADGWQVSNFPVLSGAALLASLDVFGKFSMIQLRKKSVTQIAFLISLMQAIPNVDQFIKIITPVNPNERGCQISMLMLKDGKKIFKQLTRAGVIADWRKPDVIRIAPVPLYNTYEDIFRFSEILAHTIQKL